MSTVCSTREAWGDFKGYPSHMVHPKTYDQCDYEYRNEHAVSVPDVDLAFEVMVLTLDTGYPVGVECMECRQCFDAGDIVLAGQKRMIGWIGWHTRCLKGILEDSPLDEFETTKQKLLNGEDPFE